MKDGKLLPWEMILYYLRKGIETMAKETGKTCILLDGFPRIAHQAKLFEQTVRPFWIILTTYAD